MGQLSLPASKAIKASVANPIHGEGKEIQSEERVDQERPCLLVELIDDYFAEYPAMQGRSDKVDTDEADEVIDAIAKTIAELTSGQDGMIRQQLLEQLMREIINYDAEFRREGAAGAIGFSCAALAAAKGLSTFRAAEATSRVRLDRGVRWPGHPVSDAIKDPSLRYGA